MCDIYMPEDVGKMFENEHVVVLGGSFMRGIYKDLVWLLNHPSIIPREVLGAKCEQSFPDLESIVWKEKGPLDPKISKIFHKDNRDQLIDTKGLTSGRTYIEPRKYYNKKYNLTVFYKFIVRVHSEELEEFLLEYERVHGAPINTIIMNTTLWDFNRWGPFGAAEFKVNMKKLLAVIPKVLAKQGEFIWLTCPMGAEEMNSKGMNVPGLEFQCFTSRYNVVETNYVAAKYVSEAGYGVVDIHYALQMQTFRRNKDGIHWDANSNRLVTNMLLTHVSLFRHGEEGLPGRVTDSFALDLVKLKARISREGASSVPEVEKKLRELQNLPIFQTGVSGRGVDHGARERVLHWVKDMKKQQAKASRRDEYIKKVPPDRRFHPYTRQHGFNGGYCTGPGYRGDPQHQTRDLGPDMAMAGMMGVPNTGMMPTEGMARGGNMGVNNDMRMGSMGSQGMGGMAYMGQSSGYSPMMNFSEQSGAPDRIVYQSTDGGASNGRQNNDFSNRYFTEDNAAGVLQFNDYVQNNNRPFTSDWLVSVRNPAMLADDRPTVYNPSAPMIDDNYERLGFGRFDAMPGLGSVPAAQMYNTGGGVPLQPTPYQLNLLNEDLRKRIIHFELNYGRLPHNSEIDGIKVEIKETFYRQMSGMGGAVPAYMAGMNDFHAMYDSSYANGALQGPTQRFGRGGGRGFFI